MVVWSAPQRRVKLAISRSDGMFVDACDTPAHQPIGLEFPILVTISAKPLPAVVAVFVGEADRDTVVGKGPQFLDQPVIKLSRPFAGEKGLYGFAAGEELSPISPLAVRGVGKRDLGGIARIPAILRERPSRSQSAP